MSRDALVRAIEGCLSELLDAPVVALDSNSVLADRELVGGVVAVRGAWWGVVIVRCDRDLAAELAGRSAESIDELMRRHATALARAVVGELDPGGTLSEAVVLAADNAVWRPRQAMLRQYVEVEVGHCIVVVEVHRRRRSGEVPATGGDDEHDGLA